MRASIEHQKQYYINIIINRKKRKRKKRVEAFNGKVITWDAFHVHVVVGKLKVMTESGESRAPGTTDGRTE